MGDEFGYHTMDPNPERAIGKKELDTLITAKLKIAVDALIHIRNVWHNEHLGCLIECNSACKALSEIAGVGNDKKTD